MIIDTYWIPPPDKEKHEWKPVPLELPLFNPDELVFPDNDDNNKKLPPSEKDDNNPWFEIDYSLITI